MAHISVQFTLHYPVNELAQLEPKLLSFSRFSFLGWDYVAGDCALLLFLCCRVIDVGSEWRTFNNEKDSKDNSRVGAAEVHCFFCSAHICGSRFTKNLNLWIIKWFSGTGIKAVMPLPSWVQCLIRLDEAMTLVRVRAFSFLQCCDTVVWWQEGPRSINVLFWKMTRWLEESCNLLPAVLFLGITPHVNPYVVWERSSNSTEGFPMPKSCSL